MSDQVTEIVNTILKAQIVQALNNSPDAIEKLVKAALEKPVDHNGNSGAYGQKMPYLDYLVGEEIRRVATIAVREAIAERKDIIANMVRDGLQSDSVVAAVTSAFVDAASQDWKIDVNFRAGD